MRRICAILWGITLLFLASSELLAQETTTMELARHYIRLRPMLLSFSETPESAAAKQGKLKNLLAVMPAMLLPKYGQGPDWNASNPEWQGLAQIMETDMAQIIQRMTEERLSNASKNMESGFVRGLASRLTEEELTALVNFYSSSAGKELADIQQKMFSEVGSAYFKRVTERGNNGKNRTTNTTVNQDELMQLFGLFDEFLKIQVAVIDPKQTSDAATVMASIAQITIEENYTRFSDSWRAIPELDRRAILNWRESAAGRKERKAIYETASDLKTLVNVEGLSRETSKEIMALDAKWRAIAQSRKKE